MRYQSTVGCVLIALAVIIEFPSGLSNHSGTLIAAFITRGEVFLLSDGRVISRDSGQIVDHWSKVHELTKFVGMLTAGEYIPSLADDIRGNCIQKGVAHVDGVAKITRQVLEQVWRHSTSSLVEAKKKYNLQDIVVFVFVAGFDTHKHPRLYYLDSRSHPPFTLQERALFNTGNDIELAAMSTGSGVTEDPSSMILQYLSPLLDHKAEVAPLDTLLIQAFDMTKNELELQTTSIGGRTFVARIDSARGFEFAPSD